MSKLLIKIKQILDDAYKNGEPLIIFESSFIKDPKDRLEATLFIQTYIKEKTDKQNYLRNVN